MAWEKTDAIRGSIRAHCACHGCRLTPASGEPQPRRFHFIAGLPRSGSTLLSALLKRNPRFQAHMSGPMAGIFDALLGNMSRNKFSVFINDARRPRILRGVFDSFYADAYWGGQYGSATTNESFGVQARY